MATVLVVEGSRRLAGQTEVNVPFRRGATTPVLSPIAIRHGASFAAREPIAPGTLISVFGSRLAVSEGNSPGYPLAIELDGTEVSLGGKPLPLLFVSEGQVNAQVPYELVPNTQHQLVVRRGAALSAPEVVTVAEAEPAVFTVDKSGRGQGVILGPSEAVADAANPVRAGDRISIFCTGLGVVNPPLPAGVQAPSDVPSETVNPVAVTIGGAAVQVIFSRLASGSSGVYRVDAVVPAAAPRGGEVPVVLTVARQTGPPVTMAVRE